RALKKGIEGLAPITEKVVKESEETITIHEPKKTGKTLAETAEERTTIIVEWDAPKHLDITEYMEGAEALKNAGVDAITLADNSRATHRIINVVITTKLNEIGINPLLQLTCRNRNLIVLKAHLMALPTLGIPEMLAITHDPTKIREYRVATSVFDANSYKLIE